ncbi:phage antirepressor N-terminal domain-containing protein [Flagellimonas sp.]|uniref:phage antirepressor N-terminal domain-containing protein n=1 Tax=Flagellimonas sp. TaxID=2058762 RepID=UPI003BAD040B
MSTQTLTVNEKEIFIFTENGEKYVAIKPICEAIGVSFQGQSERLKSDPILYSTIKKVLMVGSDEKSRMMQSIPFRYVFGWLFKIDPRNVKPEIQESVIKYQKECYDVLFDSFTKRTSILREKTNYQIEIDKLEQSWKDTEEYKRIQELKQKQKDATKRLNAMDKNVVSEQLDMFNSESD